MTTLWLLMEYLGDIIRQQLVAVVVLSVVFTTLALMKSQACNPTRPWWKSRDLLTDTHYLFLMPIINPYFRTVTMTLAIGLMHGAMTDAQIADYIQNSRGPVSQLPLWAQYAVYMLGFDFIAYWAHRVFHKNPLWPFHAVHHSSLDVDWTTTYRAHPVNMMLSSGLATTVMILAGVSPAIMIALAPFDAITAAFVHANLNWTLGPLKYIVATPVFHRWHHTHTDQGGDMNFGSTFAIWDVMFGTYYMPEGQLPEVFGTDDPFPEDWASQMIVPFKQFFQRLLGTRAESTVKSSAPVA